jgi:hypothetical protein
MVTEDAVGRVYLSAGQRRIALQPASSFQMRGNLFLRIHELPDAFFLRCADVDERNELLKAESGKFFITTHYDGYPACP